MAYFECMVGGAGGGATITVTYNSSFYNKTMTCSNGTKTYTKTTTSSGSTEFSVSDEGTWTITCNGVSVSLDVTLNYATQMKPTGSTATPVNDIQTWLKCGGIFNKTYTTINQVLADTTTLLALISDNNAVDYMVRSTTWANSVCANATAMTDIGANDYCADTLLSDATWASAIANSTYFESVLNVKVPTMTSNTTPSGVAFSSTLEQSSAYYAFNTSTSGALTSRNATGLAYVGYKFPSAVKPSIVKITLVPQGGTSLTSITFNIDKSADNSTWETVSTYVAEGVNSSSVLNYVIPIDTVDSNMYYRVSSDTKWFTAGTINKGLRLQFYGRASS